jgi:hypothetical protein
MNPLSNFITQTNLKISEVEGGGIPQLYASDSR